MSFEPVTTLEELRSLNEGEMLEGYLAGCKGKPAPFESQGKSYWHGWRNGMIDKGYMAGDEAYYTLARLLVNETHERKQNSQRKDFSI